MNKLSEKDVNLIIDSLERPYSLETIMFKYALFELCFEK